MVFRPGGISMYPSACDRLVMSPDPSFLGIKRSARLGHRDVLSANRDEVELGEKLPPSRFVIELRPPKRASMAP